jgi:hypothetical protein
MNFENGLIYLIAAVTVFYIRWVYIYYRNENRKRRREERELRKPVKKRFKNQQSGEQKRGFLNMNIRNWYLLAGGVVLIAIGVALNKSIVNWQVTTIYWWFFACVGILMLTFCYD